MILTLTNLMNFCRAIAIFFAFAAMASGSMITYVTPGGANIDGEPVDAQVIFTTSVDTVDIELTNFQADPNSVKQVITGIFFELSTGENSGTVSSIAGEQRDIANDGTFIDLGIGNTGWTATTQGSQILVDILNFPGAPMFGVIGRPNDVTNTYDNAGGSIAGNGSHNPFFADVANFSVDVPGVTMSSQVVAAVFQFNTVPGDNVPGVPEPSGLLLSLCGLVTISLLRRRRA